MDFKKECCQYIKASLIRCEENKRKIIFDNPNKKEVVVITVDGCQITDGIRCDFLVLEGSDEYFIELKGEDIKHAFEQLRRTISLLGNKTCTKRNSFVISSRSPLSSAEIQNMRLLFRKHYQSDLLVKNSNLTIRI